MNNDAALSQNETNEKKQFIQWLNIRWLQQMNEDPSDYQVNLKDFESKVESFRNREYSKYAWLAKQFEYIGSRLMLAWLVFIGLLTGLPFLFLFLQIYVPFLLGIFQFYPYIFFIPLILVLVLLLISDGLEGVNTRRVYKEVVPDIPFYLGLRIGIEDSKNHKDLLELLAESLEKRMKDEVDISTELEKLKHELHRLARIIKLRPSEELRHSEIPKNMVKLGVGLKKDDYALAFEVMNFLSQVDQEIEYKPEKGIGRRIHESTWFRYFFLQLFVGIILYVLSRVL